MGIFKGQMSTPDSFGPRVFPQTVKDPTSHPSSDAGTTKAGVVQMAGPFCLLMSWMAWWLADACIDKSVHEGMKSF